MARTIQLEGTVSITGADQHPHAARRLRSSPSALDWIDTVSERVPSIELRLDESMVEGEFRLSVDDESGTPRIQIVGGPFSGVIYGAEELIQRRLRVSGGHAEVDICDVQQAPALPYRTWWNWDHSTNWDTEQIGAQEIGVMNPYGKPEDGFLADFKRAVDFMSQNRIAGVTIFGFFRDSHGGIESAQELCRYANERGVRIMPGIAINAYGGVVWDMDHPYNLATWLRRNPHLAAKLERRAGFQIPGLDFKLYFPNGDYSLSGCPSRPENQVWMEEAVAWLAETCEIGGVTIEAGDYGVCGCELCEARRSEREDAERRHGYAESWSHADMADFYPRLYDAIRTRRPDAWIYSEIQWDNLLDGESMQPLGALPAGGVFQHTLNRPYWNRVKHELSREYAETLPMKTNVLRCQFACQWNGDRRTERYKFNGRVWMEMAKKAHDVGFQGLTVWGEMSSYLAANELGYLAFARSSWDPSVTWEQFVAEEAAPRLGGALAAERFLDLTDRIDTDPPSDRDVLAHMQSEALDAARQTGGDIAGRWITLADRIARRRYNLATEPMS